MKIKGDQKTKTKRWRTNSIRRRRRREKKEEMKKKKKKKKN